MASQFQTWDNPMGTDGFEFIEFAAPDPVAIDPDYLGTMPVPEEVRVPGEVTWAKHKEK